MEPAVGKLDYTVSEEDTDNNLNEEDTQLEPKSTHNCKKL